jgi:excinuclease ABC subunit A
VIKQADWIIDLGPEGGEAGGEVLATGTPEQVAEVEESATGKYLRGVLPKKAVPKRAAPRKAAKAAA